MPKKAKYENPRECKKRSPSLVDLNLVYSWTHFFFIITLFVFKICGRASIICQKLKKSRVCKEKILSLKKQNNYIHICIYIYIYIYI